MKEMGEERKGEGRTEKVIGERGMIVTETETEKGGRTKIDIETEIRREERIVRKTGGGGRKKRETEHTETNCFFSHAQ